MSHESSAADGHDENVAGEDGVTNAALPVLDEAAFMRRVKRRSRLRTMGISVATLLVAATLLLGGYVSWQRAILSQSNRIDVYQFELTPISNPNTWTDGPGRTEVQFPGARNEYTVYRPVAGRFMLVGTSYVDYDVWGGETWRGTGDLSQRTGTGRGYVGRSLAPELKFVCPNPAETMSSTSIDRDYLDQVTREFAAESSRTVNGLASAPASAVAEVAVSFSDLLTLEQLQATLPEGVRLSWGAVNVWSFAEVPVTPSQGHMVGVSFISPLGDPVTPEEIESDLAQKLFYLAELTPTGTSALTRKSARYVAKNGVRYFGAVVEGTPAQIVELVRSPKVTAAVLGFVVEPWE